MQALIGEDWRGKAGGRFSSQRGEGGEAGEYWRTGGG